MLPGLALFLKDVITQCCTFYYLKESNPEKTEVVLENRVSAYNTQDECFT